MIINGYGYQRSLAAHREQIEAAIAHHRDKIARQRAEANAQAERYAMEARHAENVAAEARMRAAREPSIASWQGAVAAGFLIALAIGAFLVANYLGS